MFNHPYPEKTLNLDRAARSATLVVLALGAAGLAGQLLHSELLLRVLPDMPAMGLSTSIALLLLGAAQRLAQARNQNAFRFYLRLFISTATGVLGLASIAVKIYHQGGASAGFHCMAFSTAFTIILCSLALFHLDTDINGHRPSQWYSIGIVVIAIWTLVGYLYSIVSYEHGVPHCNMALHTAAAFIAFGVGALLTRPQFGVMQIFSRKSAAGAMARTLLPASILMLLAIGAATALGMQMGLYDSPHNAAFFTCASILLITYLVWKNAGAIDLTEQEREEAEENARSQREWLQVMLSSIADAVIATDERGCIQFLNPVAEELTGWKQHDAVGLPAEEILQLIDAELRCPLLTPVQRVLQQHEITTAQQLATLVSRSGREIPIEDKGAPIRDAHGNLHGCVVVFRDVSDRRKADEMRLEVARQYSAMAEAIPQIVWTAHADGGIDFYNQRWFDYTGMQLDESRGWRWQTALHPEDAIRCAERWRFSVASATKLEAEARIKRHDGAYRWHLIRALPVLDRLGRISRWFGTCTDIDDQKRAAESMRFLANASTVISSSLDEIQTLQSVAQLAVPKIADLCTVHLLGDDEQLTLAAVSHMDDKKVEAVVEINRLFPPSEETSKGAIAVARSGISELAPEIDDWLIDALSSSDEHAAKLHQLGVGSYICVPLQGHRNILGVITFATLESGRRYTTRDLAMAEEVARRTALALDNNRLFAQVSDTKVEAEAANAAKDQFLAVLSHELRTPLTPVLLSVQEALRDQELPEPIREVLQMTQRNIELEARLIDDLLDLTRIERGKLQLQKVTTDAHLLLRNAIDICQPDIRSKRLRLSTDLSATISTVHGDPARIQQVFWNLIKNAVKFTENGGSISFHSRNIDSEIFEVEVQDSGIGIEPSLLPKIFNAFEQGEKSRARRFGGLGLGLTISKNLVEAHGGSIAVTSAGRDQGAKFTVRFATVQEQPSSSGVHAPAPLGLAPTSGLRILLVEDNRDTGLLLQKILKRRGHEVDLATTLKSATTLADGNEYDLLVSDMGLPDGSGLELMRHLRVNRSIPGIAMSGFGMEEDVRRSREAGFSEHLTKPVSIAKLEEAIASLTRAAISI